MNTVKSVFTVIALAMAGLFTAAPVAPSDTDREIEEAIDDLLANIDKSKSTETARLGRLVNGGLMFFGARAVRWRP